MSGTSGNDSLSGTTSNEFIDGGDGNDTVKGGGGDDTLRGGAGDDSVTSGAGNDDMQLGDGNDVGKSGGGDDTVWGGDGNDTLYSEKGTDTVDAGDGNDNVFAGADNDQVFGQAGNDTVRGEAGDDTLDGADGNDSLDGGSGDDVITGGADDDTISGGSGSDTLYGDDGDDSIDGGDDTDSIYGGSGHDTIVGGRGDDTIFGDDGDDVISGGAGNDQLYGNSGADTFSLESGGGQDIVKDFQASEGDTVDVSYSGINSFDDLSPFIGDNGNSGTLISLPDGTSIELEWVDHTSLTASQFTFSAGPVCVLHGTRISTADGEAPVQDLRPGMLIQTLDAGLQPILRVAHTKYTFGRASNRGKPIRFRAGALGGDAPRGELIVSPQHRIGMPQSEPAILVPAAHLKALSGASVRVSCKSARYYHVILSSHQLIRANGAWAESLLLTDHTARILNLPPDLRARRYAAVRPIKTRHSQVQGVQST